MDPNRDLRGSQARGVGVPLELVIGQERIRVWLDDAGIHFRHADGSTTEGHLPWSVALAASLIPFDLPRVGTVVEAA
jgi:hypothetical protein